jgi:hypothetical protein
LMWKTKKQKLLTHYQFRKLIALAWVTGNKVAVSNKERGESKNMTLLIPQ